MAYARKVDLNHKEVVNALRLAGASVYDTSRCGKGFPDIVVGYKGHTVLVEIKSGEKKPFTPDQLQFMANWRGSAVVRVNDIDGAIRLLNTLNADKIKEIGD